MEYDRRQPQHRGPSGGGREPEPERSSTRINPDWDGERAAQIYERAWGEQRRRERETEEADKARVAAMSPEEREAELTRGEQTRKEARRRQAAAEQAHRERAERERADGEARAKAQQEAEQARSEELRRQREAREVADREQKAKQDAEAKAAQHATDLQELARYERDHDNEPSAATRARLIASPDASRLRASDANAEQKRAAEAAELERMRAANRQAAHQLAEHVRAAIYTSMPRLMQPLREARISGRLGEASLNPMAHAIMTAIGDAVAAGVNDQALAGRLREVCGGAYAPSPDALAKALEQLPGRIEHTIAAASSDAREALISAPPTAAALAQKIQHTSEETLHAQVHAHAQQVAAAAAVAKLDDAFDGLAPQLLKVLRARGVTRPRERLAEARARLFDERGALNAEILAANERSRAALRVFVAEPRTPWNAHRGAVLEGLTLLITQDLAEHREQGSASNEAQANAAAVGSTHAANAEHGKPETSAAVAVETHPGKHAIDAQPNAAAPMGDWVHYLADLHRFLRDQTGAEKEALLDIRAHREEHPVVGSISETFASVKAGFHSVTVPDEGIWDQVFAQLDKAHALFANDKPDLDGAKRELAIAVKLFHEAHRKTYEYRSRTEGGAETAAQTLRGIEIACDITLVVLSAGLGAAEVNVLKLGVRGVFKLAAEQTVKSGLVKTALKAAAVSGANKLAQGATEETRGYAIDLESEFDVAKVLREAGEAAVMNFLGVLVGGALSKVFMRTLGEIIGSHMAPEAILKFAEKYGVVGVIPPELFVSKGWRFLVGVAGDACTTTLLTALSTAVEQLRTGGKRPTSEQFVALVVEQMIRNGLLQIIIGAVTHEGAKARGGVVEHVAQRGDAEHEYQYDQMRPGPLPKSLARGFYGGKYDEGLLNEPKKFYRICTEEEAKGGQEALGRWWTDEALQSDMQLQIDAAVKPAWKNPETGEIEARSPAEFIVSIAVPAGAKVFAGPVGGQGDAHLGGMEKRQYCIPDIRKIPGLEIESAEPFKRDGHAQHESRKGRHG